ncbi:MAG: hypothetical protein AB1342_07210 [Pseudomonadota bacterium]
MNVIRLSLAAFFVFSICGPVKAGGAPVQLHNKTIVLYWGQTFTWRRTYDGVTGSGQSNVERQIYISNAGRPFIRTKSSSGKNARARDAGPEKQSGRFSFDGNTMTNFMGTEGLLWHIVVTFDPSFASCSAKISIVRENGVAKGTGMQGEQLEYQSAAVGSTSCSMKDGNAFAG